MKREPFTKRKKREHAAHKPAPPDNTPNQLDDYQKEVERQIEKADAEPDPTRADRMRGGPFFW